MAVDADASATQLAGRAGLKNQPEDTEQGTATESADSLAEHRVEATESAAARGVRQHRQAFIFGVVLLLVLGGIFGWQAVSSYQTHRSEQRHQLFLDAARQGAVNLTTIGHASVEADVQRILDSATGEFRDDFEQRAQALIDAVRQVKSTSAGTVTEAGVESEHDHGAQVLVTVTVRTTNTTGVEEEPRAWRMRLAVELGGDGAKMSDVEFVP